MSLTITVSGADRHLRFSWEKASASWAAEVRPLAQAAVAAHAPVGKGGGTRGTRLGGKLRTSIRSRTEPSAGSTFVMIYTTVPYARFVIGGTRPHPIAARNAQALHWVDASGDRFARSVHHPGTRPNPFPERAIEPLRPLLMERFARAAQEAMIP